MNYGLFLQMTTGVEGAEVVPAEETLSIMSLLIGGGWYIMIPLGILSIVAVYIFIERYLSVARVVKGDTSFMERVKDSVMKGEIQSARQICKEVNNPYSRMIEKGLMRVGKPMADIGIAIENEGKLEITKLEQSLSMEATIAGAAPMIGFLGTVIGMMSAFHEMNTNGNAVELNQLAGGIMQAMVTTAAGLVIGIIAYLSYNILVGRIDKVAYKMDELSVRFIDMLQEPA
ncbi:MAG: biopolymer transport protein ExbB [Salibacteraceae bacterium]|jgi:biopolymer transport protein ExbB